MREIIEGALTLIAGIALLGMLYLGLLIAWAASHE